MARVVGTFGLQHKSDELVVNVEFNQSELCDLLNTIPVHDGFRKDIQDAIDSIERVEKARRY